VPQAQGWQGFCQAVEKRFFSKVKTGLAKWFLPAKIGFCWQHRFLTIFVSK